MKNIKMNDTAIKPIGKWIYDLSYGRFLHQEGEEFFLDNRLNRLLIILIERKESIVRREEIIDYVWQDVQVNEENLTKGIFDLRKLLKHKEITGIEIETIRNVGYRLTIQEDEMVVRPSYNLWLKATLYLFLLLSFAVILIRAIRYEN